MTLRRDTDLQLIGTYINTQAHIIPKMKYFTTRALQPPTFTYTEEDLEERRVVYHFIIGTRTHAFPSLTAGHKLHWRKMNTDSPWLKLHEND